MGRSDNPPRKHHFIPEFWTKRWAGPDGRALRYSSPLLGKVVSCRKPPSAIGWREALYNLPDYDSRVQNFETAFFKKLDQRASDLFNKIEFSSLTVLNGEDVLSFSLFIISLLHRSPTSIRLLEKSTIYMMDKVLEDLREKYVFVRSRNDPETFDDYFERYDNIQRLSHLSNVFRTLLISNQLARFIANLHWFKVDLSQSAFPLLLSDDPMIRTNGIAKPDGHIAFPLTPTIAMVGVFKREYFKEISAQNPSALARLINTQTVEAAREFVVALDDKQDRFIRNRFGKNRRPTLIEQSQLDQPHGHERALDNALDEAARR